MSLPQHGETGPRENPTRGVQRTEEEYVTKFKPGLVNVNLWYAHQRTNVWLLRWTPPHNQSIRPYVERGWPFFEQAISSLVADSSSMFDLAPQNVSAAQHWNHLYGKCRNLRKPPMSPEIFDNEVAKKVFTNG